MFSPPSPLESLTAFAIAFAVGVLSTLGLKAYADLLQKTPSAPPRENIDGTAPHPGKEPSS